MVIKIYKRMKSIFSVLFLGLILSSCLNRGTNSNFGKKHKITQKEDIELIMNKWHNDVSTFNLNEYFEVMHDSFIFLGTDPKERWAKDQFYTFCKPYFDKKTTWDFKSNWRNIYFSEDGNTAWLEESLDTWMDECRGSAVIIKEKGNWKIAHYNLTVLIENEKMNSFIKLRKE
jgi:hypothetical protein